MCDASKSVDLIKLQTKIRKANAINLEEAISVFDELADMDDIAFGYPADGCYARAHIMCRRMISAGLDAKKSWAFEGAERLMVTNCDGETTQWWYHVSAALDVTMPNGEIEQLIFDPGLFDGPVTLEEWGNAMGAQSENLQFCGFRETPDGYDGSYQPYDDSKDSSADIKAVRTMERYLETQSTRMTQANKTHRVVFPSQARQQVIDLKNQSVQSKPFLTRLFESLRKIDDVPTLAMEGRTWVSELLYIQQQNNPTPSSVTRSLQKSRQTCSV